jgi:hypothetical protein
MRLMFKSRTDSTSPPKDKMAETGTLPKHFQETLNGKLTNQIIILVWWGSKRFGSTTLVRIKPLLGSET